MRHAGARAAAAVLLFLPVQRAAGGTIAIRISSTAEVKEGLLRMAATIVNAGDETAVAVRPVFSFSGRETRGRAFETLGPQEVYEGTFSLAVSDLGPGRWPYRLAVDYTDGKHHPFQALRVSSVVLGSDPGPFGLELLGIDAPPLTGPGAVRIRVRNPGSGSRQASIGFFAPADLEVVERGRSVVIAPGAHVEVSLGIAPRTAQVGSRYAAFAVLEYDDAGVHHALVADSLVEVRERRPRLAPGLLATSGLLVLTWLILVCVRRRPPADQARQRHPTWEA